MKKLVILGLFLAATAAKAQSPSMNDLLSTIRQKYAPDKRTAIFQVELTPDGHLTGKTSSAAAHRELVEQLKASGQSFVDEVQVLPTAALNGKTQALVRVSVCNIRSAPKHSAELATQALLGTVLSVYEEEEGWYRVQTPDQYISWVEKGSVQAVTPEEASQWQQKRKLIVLSPYGFTYTEPNADKQTVSDVVAGDLLAYTGEKKSFYEVSYPDGRVAYIKKADVQFYDQWLASLKISETSLVETSKKLMGLPYLWGGTSFKGVDCSGFTKTVYFLNGVQLPRDASQQVHVGELVDTNKDWSKLKPGDLLFFGKHNDDGSERVVHVAMWVGNNQFIHSSNYVQVSSTNPGDTNYDAYNVGRYLRSKRILNHYVNPLSVSNK